MQRARREADIGGRSAHRPGDVYRIRLVIRSSALGVDDPDNQRRPVVGHGDREDVSVVQVDTAKSAGVAVGSLYPYYANKDELVARLYADNYVRLAEELKRVASKAATPRDKIAAMIRFIWPEECSS